jgi:uncharacterized protein (DUF983 family)
VCRREGQDVADSLDACCPEEGRFKIYAEWLDSCTSCGLDVQILTVGGLLLALIIRLLFLDGAVIVYKGECFLILRVRVTRRTRVTRTKVALQLSDRCTKP